MNNTLLFYSDSFVILHPDINFEYHPVRQIEEETFEQCEPEEADYWSVYIHYNDSVTAAKYGSLECIADVPNASYAKSLCELLTKIKDITL